MHPHISGCCRLLFDFASAGSVMHLVFLSIKKRVDLCKLQVLHVMSVYRSRCMSCAAGPTSANVEDIQLCAVTELQCASEPDRVV